MGVGRRLSPQHLKSRPVESFTCRMQEKKLQLVNETFTALMVTDESLKRLLN